MNTVIYDKHLVQGKHYVPGTFVSNKWLGNVDLYNGSEYEAEADPSEYLVSNYKANEQIYAGYLRWDQNITQNLCLLPGPGWNIPVWTTKEPIRLTRNTTIRA